jgi:hypothetical protein
LFYNRIEDNKIPYRTCQMLVHNIYIDQTCKDYFF